jgi:membrane-associated phospholipid phosphatase
MKVKPLPIKIHFFVCLTFLLYAGCKENTPVSKPEFPPLSFENPDANGGAWKTVIITSPEDFKIETPASTDADEYQKELIQTKNAVSQRTYAQEVAINYWASGGVLRWNQIARELVAKYNHPPKEGEPLDPMKPMASPPFAARAYALLSVAQYDALVTAWQYKYKYMRLSPSHSGVKSFLPSTELPSYPSEDAVVAAVSYKVLSKLFPAENDYLYNKALEHGNTRLWAGANVKSDIMAGGILGEQVAEKIIAYALSDNFDNAKDDRQTWKAKAQKVKDAWVSQDDPKHAPLLPLMGLVRTWFDKEQVLGNPQPPAPPTLKSDEFKQDIDSVKKIGDTRTEEQKRIAEFWSDGVGTFTPPGHWNKIAEELIRNQHFTELRIAKILQQLNRAEEDAAIACWATKYKYFFPRPTQVDKNIKNSLNVPNFPSYTSGHSTFSAAAALVLGHYFPKDSVRLKKMANEAGMSRIYGGIHYFCDNEGGKMCGEKIGKLAIDWGK